MKNKHLNILYPQWQGGGLNKATYDGAMELKKNYLDMNKVSEIIVNLDESEKVENNIWGYSSIVKQMNSFKELLDSENPETIFTIGGGDDIEVLPMSYMNSKMNSDMTVVFFDAHGDLNTPESSPSKNFHGMPLRTLFGESDSNILNMMYSFIKPEQVIMIGTRDCDQAEEEYIKSNSIQVITAEEINENVSNVIEAVRLKECNNIYIHIDVDVMDPEEFPYQPVPAKNGVKINAFSETLRKLNETFNVVGVCLLGYTTLDDEKIEILEQIIDIGMM
jgi:arginase